MQTNGDSIGVVPTVKNLPKVQTPRSRLKQEDNSGLDLRAKESKYGLTRKQSIKEAKVGGSAAYSNDDSGMKSEKSAGRTKESNLRLPLQDRIQNQRKTSSN